MRFETNYSIRSLLMTRRKQSRRLVLWVSLALPVMAGCDANSSSPSPLPTEAVSIFVGGQCRVAVNMIVCRDASRSEPRNRLTAIDWELISNSTGLSLGSSPSAPGGEVSFTGLAIGSYQVNQTVSAQDHSAQRRTYGPLTVTE
jgi:hypothetical protein